LAKKRRQKAEKKEEYDFDIPEFDEYKFISLELNKAKISLVAFIYAIIMVIITFQLYTITYPDARAPVVLGLLAVAGIPFITKFVKVDISEFDWKNWVGSGAVYVFSWLAIFILLCNPPFSDFVEPEIHESITYIRYYENGDLNSSVPVKWESWDTDVGVNRIAPPLRINISVKIEDNSPIIKNSVKITISDILNNSIKNIKMKSMGDNRYKLDLENNNQPFQKGEYEYRIEAKDSYGHKGVKSGKFQII